MTNTSLHNHSTWSDGAADITAMATAARDAGLNVFGISDHWVMLPPGCRLKTEWSISADRLDGYFQECLAVRKQVETERFSLRIGLEVDFFPETWQENMALLARYPLDYTIGSIHYLDDFPIDSSPAPWENLDQDSINDLWRQYWLRVRALAETRAFTIIGHLDLPKKFGFTATADLNAEIDAALLAIRESGAQLELNTAGWSKPCAEPYPSPELLRRALALGIPPLITADAHDPRHVKRDFPRAAELLARLAGTGAPCQTGCPSSPSPGSPPSP